MRIHRQAKGFGCTQSYTHPVCTYYVDYVHRYVWWINFCYVYIYLASFYIHIAAIVNFSQLMYSVNEDDVLIQPMLILSNPSSRDFTIDVLNTDISTSECNQPYSLYLYNMCVRARYWLSFWTIHCYIFCWNHYCYIWCYYK